MKALKLLPVLIFAFAMTIAKINAQTNTDYLNHTENYSDGSKYIGGWLNGKRNGQGTYTWSDGSRYVGGWLNDNKNGQGTYTWSDGSKYVGSWLNDNKNGQGTYTWSDGRKYVGGWLNDKQNGQGTFTWSDGSEYIGGWLEDEFNGQGTCTWPDGSKYVGGWLNHKQNGQGTFTWPDGSKYVGGWLNDKQNGQGTLTWPNGSKYVGGWLEDKCDGQGIGYFSNGKIWAQVEYKEGKLWNTIVHNMPDGTPVKEKGVRNGNGNYKFYSPQTGNLEREVSYKNGDLHGEFKSYYDNGMLWSHIIYSKGKIWNTITHNLPDGKPTGTSIKNGNGIYIENNKDGSIVSKTTYLKGVKINSSGPKMNQ
jgi:antitoxin component YwqK of YwqJK toxin-antitoxin module